MSILNDLPLILFCLLLSGMWSIMIAPFLLKYTHVWLADAGWGIATTLGWIVVASVIWFLAHLGLPILSQSGVLLVSIVTLGGSVYFIRQHRQELATYFKRIKPFVYLEEGLFIVGFLLMSSIRGFKPEILDLEKFMDAGFINMYLHVNTLPAPDMWLTGYTINYYTFGHFLGAIASHTWSLPIATSYNLILGLLMGLLLKLSASLVINTIHAVGNTIGGHKQQKIGWQSLLAGGVASFLVVLGGNTHKAWYWFKHGSFEGYWYPDATRFIPYTIHEFPAYSFVVSDLHAHLFSLPLVLVLATCILVWLLNLKEKMSLESFLQSPVLWWTIVVGVLLGLIASTSTWDTLMYGLLLLILGTLLVVVRHTYFFSLFYSAVIMGISALLSSAPWWFHFESISDGVALVTTRSPLWQFVVLWVGHGTIALLALGVCLWMMRSYYQQPSPVKRLLSWLPLLHDDHKLKGLLFMTTLILTAIALLIIPELVYVKDIYPDHPRANTMFKLTFQSIVMMSLVAGWLLGIVLQSYLRSKVITGIYLIALCCLLIATSIYPYGAFKSYYGLTTYQGLDGLEWLKNQYPNDYAAIMWLNATQPRYNRPVIAEAVGESYTTFARVSTFTAMPTILGWRVHEWLWRGSFDIPGSRTTEVETIYTQPLSAESKTLLKTYQVAYIFVGDKEREAYPNIQIAQLKQLGSVVFRNGETFIVQVE